MRFCSASVLLCCGRKGERESEVGGLRVEAEGKMSKLKFGNLWESGKTSSERESKIFSPSFENE